MTADMVTAALGYAAHGWPVFPLRGKLPARPKSAGGRGFKDATCDSAGIEAMWHAYPGSNIGIRTGRSAGIAVLDVDPDTGGVVSLATIQRQRGPLPATVMAVTGGGGLHLLYRWQPGLGIGSAIWGAGLDLRGEGGYIVAAPSVHPGTGQPYSWRGDWTAALPEWPSAHLPPKVLAAPPTMPTKARSRSDGCGALAGLVRVILDATPGTRNDRLNWAAYRARHHVAAGWVDARVAVSALYEAAIAVGTPGTEAERTIASGLGAVRESA